MLKSLQTENALRNESIRRTNILWKQNRDRIMSKNAEDDAKMLRNMFLYLVRIAIYKHFETPTVIWNRHHEITIELHNPLFKYVEAHASLLQNSVQEYVDIVHDFLDLPKDIKEYRKVPNYGGVCLRMRISNAYGSRCWLDLTIDQGILNETVRRRNSILLLQKWMRKCLYEPSTGILYKKSATNAIKMGFQP